MPFVTTAQAKIYFKQEGRSGAPPLVLLNSIGTDIDLWAPLLASLRPEFRLLRIDTRGHGASGAPPGDYTLAGLAADVRAVMDVAGIARAAIAGVSLGGMIAMQLALDHPAVASSLLLICTSAHMDPSAWQDRVDLVRRAGMIAVTDLAISRFFSRRFIAAHPEVVDTVKECLLSMAADGYAGCAAAIRSMALSNRLGEIDCPTMVITGNDDVSTPFAGYGEKLIAQIAGARHAALDGAHLLPLEAPDELAEIISTFLHEERDFNA